MQNTTAQRIKAIRKQKNMHQREVAEQLNIAQSTYAKIEQGVIKLDTERLISLAKIFDVPYEDFLPTQVDKNINFSNNQITTGFIEHYYDGIKEAYESQISTLKEEITFLRKLVEEKH